MRIQIADLFCGAGGTSEGALQALRELGYEPMLTAVNHWDLAVKTHTTNHPDARHFCASVDSLNPRELFAGTQLDFLWASPECTHHSVARGGKPMLDQSRASAHCVTRWAEALQPRHIMVENVPEFRQWGPLDLEGRPIPERKGETFDAWVGMLRSLGYTVDWRILCAADYGDPTTRKRLFVQAVLHGDTIRWPAPTHDQHGANGLPRWRPARDVIDWEIPSQSISERKRPLAPSTVRRINAGLRKLGMEPFLISMEHGGRVRSVDRPINTITTARGGAHALVEPFVVKFYGTGTFSEIDEPVDTVTTKSRFGLAEPEVLHDGDNVRLDIRFRMLQPHELAKAQGFPDHYKFLGNKTQVVKQIGNAVPCGLARALVMAAMRKES